MTPSKEAMLRLSLRWLLNTSGLWLAGVLMSQVNYDGGLLALTLAGLVLSAINAVLKPALIILSLPAILVSLGLFTIFVNGFMLVIADWLVPGFSIDSYGAAVLAGIVISLLNYSLTAYLEERIFS